MREAEGLRLPVEWALAIVLSLLTSAFSFGGDWHSGSQLVCSDCHTMHNSSGGQPMRYDQDPGPASQLLRHASALSLCVYCHDGSKPSAPDVVLPISYVADPLGGSFPTTFGIVTGRGHALGTPNPLVPPGGLDGMVLTCVSCHDPHGGPNYRNLKTDPLRTGGPELLVAAKQSVTAGGGDPARVYVAANVIDKSGMSQWCGACHGAFHGKTTAGEGTASPWLRHPQDQTISTSRNVDAAHWLGTIANRARVESPSDDVVPSTDDQVFCLSCHKAHGSANRAALFFADGARLGSTCQQCHNK